MHESYLWLHSLLILRHQPHWVHGTLVLSQLAQPVGRVDDMPVTFKSLYNTYRLGELFPAAVGNSQIPLALCHCHASSNQCVPVLIWFSLYWNTKELLQTEIVLKAAFPGVDSKPVQHSGWWLYFTDSHMTATTCHSSQWGWTLRLAPIKTCDSDIKTYCKYMTLK